MDNLWYKNAVFYSMDLETYLDSNDDGIGDFPGMASKLGYLSEMGITCIWLLPFYPSPNHDNGYDVMDYYNVDSRIGTLEDCGAFMEKAQGYGIRVIIDLVINHTSIQHPWFQAARKDKNSKYRNYYVWSEEPIPHAKEKLIFAGEEEAVWTYVEEAEMYYLHRFYKEQPDLNISNPEVRKEILKVMDFWLNLGVSGFRVDAAEILIEPFGMKEVKEGELEKFLDEMQDFVFARRRDGILLAEANIKPEEIYVYFNKEKRMHMLFNFYLNQHLFLGMAGECSSPIIEALQKLPEISPEEQWLNFLRHHDELNLKLLDQDEQNKIYQIFAPEKGMRIFERGIRRRLPPMLENDRGRLELAYSLMFSLPGAPLIRYGDEIGMGDDLKLPGRESVRTAMQWSDGKNGGFSDAPEDMLSPPRNFRR